MLRVWSSIGRGTLEREARQRVLHPAEVKKILVMQDAS
jgi:hypothetical protein